MEYFNIDDTLLEITDKYPETIAVFAAKGFPQMEDKEKRESFGKKISLKTALMLKQLDYDTFSKLLMEQITQTRLGDDITLMKAPDAGADALKVVGLLPCPVRIPLLEEFKNFRESHIDGGGRSIDYELKAASMGISWLEGDIQDEKKLPDIFISAGFDMFFDKKLMGKYIDSGIFEDFSGISGVNSSFADIGLKDPSGHFGMIGVVPAVFLINTKELGDTPVPRTWEALFSPAFENKVSLPVGDFDLFNAILINIQKKYGDEGVRKLGRSLLESLHPSQMVSSEKKKVNRPVVTIMPYFFTKTVKEGSSMIAVWPEDGAIISPIFILAKKEKKDDLQPLVDFFSSEKVGEVLAHQGLFPSTHPSIDNRLKEENKFMWPGWDYLYEHDIDLLIKHCEEVFESSVKGEA